MMRKSETSGRSVGRVQLAAVGATLAVVGGVVGIASPASALAPHVSVHTYSAYNYADSYGTVWSLDHLTSGVYKYGNPATLAHWSYQSLCWTNVDWYDYAFQA